MRKATGNSAHIIMARGWNQGGARLVGGECPSPLHHPSSSPGWLAFYVLYLDATVLFVLITKVKLIINLFADLHICEPFL